MSCGQCARQRSDAPVTFIRLPEIDHALRHGGDDDANSIVARELAVGGKVATSILDTPASSLSSPKPRSSVATPARGGRAAIFRGHDRRLLWHRRPQRLFQIRGFDASTYRDGITLGGLRGIREEPLALRAGGGHPWCQLDPIRASRSGRLDQLRDQATARGTVLRGVRHSRIDSRRNTGSTSATC